MNDNPIFIVGPSRSGTTMLQRALSQHSSMHITAETHWFDDPRSRSANNELNDDDRTRVQNWFLSLSDKPFGYHGTPENGWLSRKLLESSAHDVARASNKSEVHCDDYFSAYCMLDAKRHNKARWGEKTPRHVFRIEDIHEKYKNAKFICMLRDPRSILASYREWSNRPEKDDRCADRSKERQRTRTSYHPLIAALLWRAAARAAMQAQVKLGDEKVIIVRYESLLNDGERCIEAILSWLGECYEHQVPKVPMANSSFLSYKAKAGFETSAAKHWRRVLTKNERAVVSIICGSEMKKYNYSCTFLDSKESPRYFRTLLLAAPSFLSFPSSAWTAFRANHDRVGNLPAYVWRRMSK